MSDKLQSTIVYIIFGLKRDEKQIRICLLLLHNQMTGQNKSGEEAYIGLELNAKEAYE